MIVDIFKIPLYGTTLDLDTSLYNDYAWKYQETNVSEVKSNVLGYHSSNLLGGSIDPLIKDLKAAILPHCVKFADALDYYSDRVTIDNMWFNISLFKDYNKEHIHPNSVLSGVWYSDVPENSGNIEFIHPSDGIQYTNNFNTLREDNNRYTANLWHYEAKPNTLYLFPGWLKHRVTVNKSEKARISYSFNCVIGAPK